MKTVTVVPFLVLISFAALASRKGIDLDQSKTLESIEECQRISSWQLMQRSDELEINCGEDNHTFIPKNPSAPTPGKLRIGNFNLLHPGTDKTIFKDFDLVAELVDSQFDVMAGIELVDVVADPEKKNKRLRPYLETKFKPVSEIQSAVEKMRQEIISLESQVVVSTGPSAELILIKVKLAEAKSSYDNARLGLDSAIQLLAQAELEVSENAAPGLVIFGKELFKKQRLARLEAATARKIEAEKNVANQKKLMADVGRRMSELQLEADRLGKTPAVDPILAAKISELKKELTILLKSKETALAEFQKLSRYYRIPGYLTLLQKLRERNSNWAFVISPHGDAAEETNTQERVGYYYRIDKVSLTKNVHCSDRFTRDSSACYPNLYQDYMGDDVAELFSRRPFLATFSDGKAEFSLLASHVVFEPPRSEELQKKMLMKAFKVEKLSDLGTGINKQNFARFVEVSLSMDLVDKLRRDGMKRVIYTGDFNLESENQFWKKILKDRQGTKVLISEQTSVSEVRFAKNVDTQGLASNYDHFVLSEEDLANCSEAAHVNFVTGSFSEKVKQKYLVRQEAAKGPYLLTASAEAMIAKHTEETRQRLMLSNFSVSNKGEISLDEKTMASDLANLRERVFTSQLSDATYYKLFVQIISDHLPIRMVCRFE